MNKYDLRAIQTILHLVEDQGYWLDKNVKKLKSFRGLFRIAVDDFNRKDIIVNTSEILDTLLNYFESIMIDLPYREGKSYDKEKQFRAWARLCRLLAQEGLVEWDCIPLEADLHYEKRLKEWEEGEA